MKRDNASRTIITKKYQLIYYFSEGRSVKFPVDIDPVEFAGHRARCRTTGARPFIQLFDLENDPYELNNISVDENYKKVIEELTVKLHKWMVDVNDPILKGPVASPYYTKAKENLNQIIAN